MRNYGQLGTQSDLYRWKMHVHEVNTRRKVNLGNGVKMPFKEEICPLTRRILILKLLHSDKSQFEIGAKITCKYNEGPGTAWVTVSRMPRISATRVIHIPCLWWPPSRKITRSSVARLESKIESGAVSIPGPWLPQLRGTAIALVAKLAGLVQPRGPRQWWPPSQERRTAQEEHKQIPTYGSPGDGTPPSPAN